MIKKILIIALLASILTTNGSDCMAIPSKTTAFTKKVTDLIKRPVGYTWQEIQEYIETPSNELLTKQGEIIDYLVDTFGATPPPDASAMAAQAYAGFNPAFVAHKADNVKHVTSTERTTWNGKVDQVAGKGLSANDYDNTEKAEVEKIEYLKTHGNRFVRALGNRLSMAAEDACMLVQGDSTGNDLDEWVYQAFNWLIDYYPKYTFLYKVWDHGTQDYDAGTTFHEGTGGDYHLTLTGGYASTPDKASLDITGDIDIIAKVASTDWTSGAAQTIVSKFGDGGQRGWALAINSLGFPYIWWSNDGSANATEYATTTLTVPDGDTIWIRATLDVDNGSGLHVTEFHTSTDGVTYSQLGDVVFTAGAISLFSNNYPVQIGCRTSGAEPFIGKIHEVTIKNGIHGTVVAHPIITRDTVSPFADEQGNVWTLTGNAAIDNTPPVMTVLNASTPGAAIAYSTDPTRFDKQALIEPQLSFISYSHNETSDITYQTTYEGLATQILTKYPNTGVVCVTQNPKKVPDAYVKQHAIRNSQIAMLAAKNNYGLVDAYKAFIDTGGYEDFVEADGTHPNAAGKVLWKDEAIKFLYPAIP
jgi:lysophospholipase L1-like esterase